MGAEDNGLTLESLAQRLEALERENERMCSENAELQHKVATLEGSGTHRDKVAALRGSETRWVGDEEPASESSGPDGQVVSRRWLLSKAGAAAVGTVAAGALLLRDAGDAKADHYADGIKVDYVVAHYQFGSAVSGSGINGVIGEALPAGSAGVYGYNNNSAGGIGVDGKSANGTGVKGDGKNGVVGVSYTSSWSAVLGENNTENGVGILGKARNGYGVQGYGHHAGVYGRSSSNGKSAVWGDHNGAGIGVRGYSTKGIGGLFQGGRAQLRLVPKGSAGPPTGSHAKGEIYMDKAGTLFEMRP